MELGVWFENCREQYAVDAYTFWGGYSSGGYYPSKNRMLCADQGEVFCDYKAVY